MKINKPWVDSKLKALLKEKRKAYMNNDQRELKSIPIKIDAKILEHKKDYKDRMGWCKNNDCL